MSTIVVHVVVLGFATTKSVAILSLPARRGEFMLRFCVVIGAIALLASLLLALEAGLWAAAYRHVGALPDAAAAMLY